MVNLLLLYSDTIRNLIPSQLNEIGHISFLEEQNTRGLSLLRHTKH